MHKLYLVLVFLFFYFNGNSQTVLKEDFTATNIYDVDFIARASNGNFIGMYEGGGSGYPYTFVFDKRLRNKERKLVNKFAAGHIGFYHDYDNLIHVYVGYLTKVTKDLHEGKAGKITKSILKVSNGSTLSTQIVGNSIISTEEYKSRMECYKYNIVTGELESKLKDTKNKGDQFDMLRAFYLKNGNIMVIGHIHKFQPQAAYGLGPVSNGFRVSLYNSEMNLIHSIEKEDMLHYSFMNAFSFESNTEEGGVLYFWARDVKTNKMKMYKISAEEDKITVKENELVLEDIETTFLNDKIDEKQYKEIFSALITDMAADKKRDTQGDDYIIDSSYTLHNKTYVSYHVVQNIKGKANGAIVLVGVFELNEVGGVVKNMVVDFQFHPVDQNLIPKHGDAEQFQMFYKRHKVHPFYDGDKITYFYVINSMLTGFEIDMQGKITKLPEIAVSNPTVNKGVKLPFVHTILPLDDHSFFLKARHGNVTDEGIAIILKSDYTLYTFKP